MRRWAQEISTTPWLTYGIPDYGLNYHHLHAKALALCVLRNSYKSQSMSPYGYLHDLAH